MLLEPPWSTVLVQLATLLPPGELMKFAMSKETLKKPTKGSKPGPNGSPPREAPNAPSSAEERESIKRLIDEYVRRATAAREALLTTGNRLQTEQPDISNADVQALPAAQIEAVLRAASTIAATWAPRELGGAPVDFRSSVSAIDGLLSLVRDAAVRGEFPPPGL